jgi:hypothetical protein
MADHESVMRDFSARTPGRFEREVAGLLIEVFRPRMDLFACRIDDPEAASRLTAWERERFGARGRTWTVGDWRPTGTRAQRRPVTVDDVAWHVAGTHTLGFYPLHVDGTCRSVSADFDNHRGGVTLARDPVEDFAALRELLRREDVPHLAHRSRGGGGWWVHLLLPDGTRAREARAVLHGMLAAAGARPVREGGTFDSLFPKQDEATAQGPGNLFCLPLSRRWLAADSPGSGFVDVDPRDFDGQVYHLWKARRIDAARWRELVVRFPAVVPTPVRAASVAARGPSLRGSAPVARGTDARGGAWEIALRHARLLGRPLGEGRHALLCPQDALHTTPDRSVENARGSCVLFPPSPLHPDGYPWCAHAHCAHRTTRDWIDAVGRERWDDACLAVRGMRRAGPWVLHAGGITTWYRAGDGTVLPSRRDRLCEVPLWIAEEVVSRGRRVRVVEAIVRGRTKRLRVRVDRFAELAWLAKLGVDVAAMAPWARAKLVEAIERLSEPVPLGAGMAVDQVAAQARADELLRVLDAVRRAGEAAGENEGVPARSGAVVGM